MYTTWSSPAAECYCCGTPRPLWLLPSGGQLVWGCDSCEAAERTAQPKTAVEQAAAIIRAHQAQMAALAHTGGSN